MLLLIDYIRGLRRTYRRAAWCRRAWWSTWCATICYFLYLLYEIVKSVEFVEEQRVAGERGGVTWCGTTCYLIYLLYVIVKFVEPTEEQRGAGERVGVPGVVPLATLYNCSM